MAAKWWRYNSTSHIFEQSLDEGTTWTKPPLDASIITEGVFDIARLPPYPTVPANIAYTNVENTFSLRQIMAGASGLVWNTAPLEIQTTATPRIAFHWPGVTAAQIGINSSGVITALDAAGTGYADFVAKVIASTGNVMVGGNVHNTGGYIYPGRIDASGGSQGSWYLAGHASYGLYTNSGLYVVSNIWGAAIEGSAHIRAAAGLYDYARATPIGVWTAWGVPPSYLFPSGGHNWTNATIEYYYMFIGNTGFINCYCTGTTSPHTVTAIYYLYVPFNVARMSTGTGGHVYNATSPTLGSSLRVYGVVGANYVEVRMANGANFPISSTLYFSFSFFMPFG